jgi:hypothetical protein
MVNELLNTVAVYCQEHTGHTHTHCVGRIKSYSVLKKVVQLEFKALLRNWTGRKRKFW